MPVATAKIRRPALRWHGGKFGVHGTVADWVIGHLPPHEHYVEPFAGAGSVLLRKAPSKLETYNDLDRDVVCFFRVLRERPEELIQMIELTPWSRAAHKNARQPIEGSGSEADLERARRLFVRSWMGRGKASMQTAAGWRYEVQAKRGTRPYSDVRKLDHLHRIAERLSHVQIECDDAAAVIERFASAGTCYYLDPPYVHSTRSRRWKNAYQHEMTDGDHAELLSLCRRQSEAGEGAFVISGYPSDLYAEGLEAHGWHRVEREQTLTDGRGATRPTRTECLWLCPRAQQRDHGPLFG